jgi:sugar lactone lactonase YvrE
VNNQVMLEAFQFAGYDAKLELGDEAHNMKHGAAIMPDALRWLWRGYPAPITVKEPVALDGPGWDPRGKVSSVVSANQPWEKLHAGAISAVAGLDGKIYFANGNSIFSATEGKVQSFQKNVGLVSALAVGSDGQVYAGVNGRIVSYGREKRTLMDKVEASGLAVTAKGAVYYVDRARKRAGKAGGAAVDLDMLSPAGIALAPDDGMAVVTDAGGRFSWSYQVASEGSLQHGEPFFRLEMPESGWMSDVRGVALDTNGQVYFATALGIQMCEANGRVAAILHRAQIRGLAFGGNYLYAATDQGLWRRPVKVKGGVHSALPKPPL